MELVGCPTCGGLGTVPAILLELEKLTPREREILPLLTMKREALARKLFISPYTIKTYMDRIYKKLGVHKKAQLAPYIVALEQFGALKR